MFASRSLPVIEHEELVRLQNARDRNRLIEANVPLAKSIVKLFWRSGRLRNNGTFEDALQDAYVAMITAVDKFDASHKDANWTSYLAKSIRRYLLLRGRIGGVIQFSGHALTRKSKEKSPSIYQAALRALSIADVFQNDGRRRIKDDDALYYEPDPSLKLIQEELDGLLNKLPERHRLVIEERFGLRDGKKKTLQEIGETLHITKERVRQQEIEIIGKLRKGLEGKLAAA